MYFNKKINGNMFSLQYSCLRLIVKNFHRFNFALTASNDAKLQKNLYFLQRCFSDYLATKLLKDGKSIDPYFEFLINEHLTSLHFFWFESSQYLKSIDDIFCRLPNLKRISFDFCGDEILESVAKFCPKILEIYAFDRNITDKGIKCLCETKNGKPPCPELKKIYMMECFVTDRGAECLIQNLPSLQHFDYPDLPLVLHSIHAENSCENRKIHFNLTELDLTHRGVPYSTDVLETCLAVCPKLESIFCVLSGKDQLNVLANNHPKELTLIFCEEVPNVDEFIIANGRNLTFLEICSCTLSAAVLAAHCRSLEDITITDVNFTDDDNLKVTFPSLTSCSINYNTFAAEKTFRILSSSPKLKFVSFSRCILSWELKTQILIWCTTHPMIDVEFEDMYLEVRFLKDFILQCHSLKRMRLSRCKYDVYNYNAQIILSAFFVRQPNKPVIEIETLYD